MKQQFFIIKILLVLGISFIFLSTVRAQSEETPLQYNLDTKYSGVSPGSSAPWLTAVFDSNEANDKDPNKVLLTMSAPNLTAPEGVRRWCFNFTLDPNGLTFSHVSGPVAVEIRQNVTLPAGGGGYFDFLFIFADGEFNSGNTSVYEISYTSPITAGNFSKISEPGGGRGRYGSAALVNNINGDNKLGWIGDSGTGSTAASGS